MMNQSKEQQQTVERKKDRWYASIDLSMFLLLLYVFLLYTAQDTLLPPAIHSVVMYGFIACVFVKAVVSSHAKIKLSYYSIWYLLLILLSFLSLIWATHQTAGSLYPMFVSFVITFCVVDTLNTAERLEICLRMFVIAADAMGIMLLVTGQVFSSTGERLGQSVTGNANSFSALLMVAAVFSAWFFVFKGKKSDRVFHIVSLGGLLFLMAIAGGRKTILAVVACYILFSFLKNASSTLRMLATIVKIAAVVVAMWFAIMKIPVLYDAIGERFEQLFVVLTGGTSSVHSDSVRELMVKIAIEQWTYRPLLGYGLDTFKYYNRTVTGHFYYAHNNYAELLYDLGLVGFLLYYVFVAYLLVRLLKQLKSSNKMYAGLGIGLILEMLVFDIGGVSYYTVMMQDVFCLAFTCMVHSKANK